MKIIYRQGNLLRSEERVIVHGCNAKGVMGSGVAAAIRAEYPLAYTEYRKTYEREGLRMGGTIWVTDRTMRTDQGCDRTVINAITQEDFGRDPNIVYADYEAIRTAMRTINEAALTETVEWPYFHRVTDFRSIGMPLIGAGLANGDWKIISAIIEEECTRFQPVVYILDVEAVKTIVDPSLVEGAAA